MELQRKNFLEIISSYITKNEADISNPDWAEIYKLAQIHSLSGMLYIAVKDNGLCDDKDVYDSLSKAFMATVSYSIAQEYGLNRMVALLNQHKVKHIVFKGAVIKQYFQPSELRTMGDIDIAITGDDKALVHKLLLEAGYEYDEFNSHSDVANYSKNGVCFEIHKKIISKNLFKDVDCVGYFDDLFKFAKQKNLYSYELANEIHFIYLIIHMAKHFKYGGCGLRMFIDIAMFLNYLENDFDWDFVHRNLDYLKLSEFTNAVVVFCNKYFGSQTKLDYELSEEKLEEITDYVLAGGTFGYYEKNIDAIRLGGTGDNVFSKLKGVLKLLFPSHEHLKERYECFGKLPQYLLPLGWVKYWFYRLRLGGKNDLKRFKSAMESSNDARKHENIMVELGLDRK